MRHTLRLALGSFVLLVSSMALAQTGGADYYPLKTGTKWVYKVLETTITVKVASADAEGAKLEIEVNGKAVASEVIKVTPEGIVRTKINNAKIEPPVMILKLKDGKATKGEKWAIASTIADQKVKGEFSVKDDKEKIKTAIGDLEAIAVEGNEFDIAGTKTSVKYWFVAGKGIVKLMYNIQNNEAVLELKEYTEAPK